MAAPKLYSTGVLILTNPTGAERVEVDTGGPQKAVMSLGAFAALTGPVTTSSTATTAVTLTPAQAGGPALVPAEETYLMMTGALGGAAALTVPTVAQMLAAFPSWVVGQSYVLTITNAGGGFNWTLTGGGATGWTLAGGSAVIATNTWRKFIVTLTSLSAITATMVAVGTYS